MVVQIEALDRVCVADLRLFVRLADEIRKRDLEVAGEEEVGTRKLTTKEAARALGLSGSTAVKDLIERLEHGSSTWFFERLHPGPKVNGRRQRAQFPEDVPRGQDRPEVRLALTLDGEIWLKFATSVVMLYDLTTKATKPFVTKPAMIRSWQTMKNLQPIGPGQLRRPSEDTRRNYHVWIEHHLDNLMAADAFSRQSAYASVHHLNWMVPGHRPDPAQEPPWDAPDQNTDGTLVEVDDPDFW